MTITQTHSRNRPSPLTVSALGLGCMGMSEFYGTADEQRAIDTIHRALDLGVTFLDTADMYGPFTNEQLVGRAITGRRDEVQLATKFGNVRGPDGSRVGINGSPEYVRAGLRRLAAAARRRPHRPLLPAPRRQDRADRGDRRRDGGAGRGRQGPPPRPVRGGAPTRSAGRTPSTRSPRCRREYSLFTRDLEDEILPTIRELGIGLVPYSPLGRGILTGAITRDAGADGDGDFRRSAYFPRFQGEALDANLALVEKIRAIADEKGCTPGPARTRLGARAGRRRRADPRHQAGDATSRRTSAATAVELVRRRPRGTRDGRPARRRRRRPVRRHATIDA